MSLALTGGGHLLDEKSPAIQTFINFSKLISRPRPMQTSLALLFFAWHLVHFCFLRERFTSTISMELELLDVLPCTVGILH